MTSEERRDGGRLSVTQGLDALFAAFHRTPPKNEVYEHLGRVSREIGMTDDAVEAAFAGLRGRHRLPDNLELELRDAWRRWCEAGGISPAGLGGSCPDCGGTGWILAWRSGDRPGTGPIAVPCACGAAREDTSGLTGGVREWTAGGLVSGGWSLRWPLPAGAAQAVTRAAVRNSVLQELAAEDARAGRRLQPPAPAYGPAPEPEDGDYHFEDIDSSFVF